MRGPRYRCTSCLQHLLNLRSSESETAPETQNTNKNITINIRKSRKDLKEKCRKITKKHNDNKVKNKINTKSGVNSTNSENENKDNLPEIKIEPIDFLNNFINELNDNTKTADSSHLLDYSSFYPDLNYYDSNCAYI